MSVIYCERGQHYVDTDFDASALVGDEEVCEGCLTDSEIEKLDGEDVEPTEINLEP